MYVLVLLDAGVVIAEILLDLHAMRSQYREAQSELRDATVFLKGVYSADLQGYDGSSMRYILDTLQATTPSSPFPTSPDYESGHRTTTRRRYKRPEEEEDECCACATVVNVDDVTTTKNDAAGPRGTSTSGPGRGERMGEGVTAEIGRRKEGINESDIVIERRWRRHERRDDRREDGPGSLENSVAEDQQTVHTVNSSVSLGHGHSPEGPERDAQRRNDDVTVRRKRRQSTSASRRRRRMRRREGAPGRGNDDKGGRQRLMGGEEYVIKRRSRTVEGGLEGGVVGEVAGAAGKGYIDSRGESSQKQNSRPGENTESQYNSISAHVTDSVASGRPVRTLPSRMGDVLRITGHGVRKTGRRKTGRGVSRQGIIESSSNESTELVESDEKLRSITDTYNGPTDSSVPSNGQDVLSDRSIVSVSMSDDNGGVTSNRAGRKTDELTQLNDINSSSFSSLSTPVFVTVTTSSFSAVVDEVSVVADAVSALSGPPTNEDDDFNSQRQLQDTNSSRQQLQRQQQQSQQQKNKQQQQQKEEIQRQQQRNQQQQQKQQQSSEITSLLRSTRHPSSSSSSSSSSYSHSIPFAASVNPVHPATIPGGELPVGRYSSLFIQFINRIERRIPLHTSSPPYFPSNPSSTATPSSPPSLSSPPSSQLDPISSRPSSSSWSTRLGHPVTVFPLLRPGGGAGSPPSVDQTPRVEHQYSSTLTEGSRDQVKDDYYYDDDEDDDWYYYTQDDYDRAEISELEQEQELDQELEQEHKYNLEQSQTTSNRNPTTRTVNGTSTTQQRGGVGHNLATTQGQSQGEGQVKSADLRDISPAIRVIRSATENNSSRTQPEVKSNPSSRKRPIDPVRISSPDPPSGAAIAGENDNDSGEDDENDDGQKGDEHLNSNAEWEELEFLLANDSQDGGDVNGSEWGGGGGGNGTVGEEDKYKREYTYADRLLHIAHILHYIGIGILGLFVVQILLKMFGMSMEFFKKKLEMFDAVIVLTSFSLDLIFVNGITGAESEEAIALLIIFLLWRILRIINGIMVTSKKRQDFQMQLQKRARRRAEKKVEYLEDDRNWKEREIHNLRELCTAKTATEEEIAACKPRRRTIFQKMDTSMGLSSIATLSLGLSMSMAGAGRAVISQMTGECRQGLKTLFPAGMPAPKRPPGRTKRNSLVAGLLQQVSSQSRLIEVTTATTTNLAGPGALPPWAVRKSSREETRALAMDRLQEEGKDGMGAAHAAAVRCYGATQEGESLVAGEKGGDGEHKVEQGVGEELGLEGARGRAESSRGERLVRSRAIQPNTDSDAHAALHSSTSVLIPDVIIHAAEAWASTDSTSVDDDYGPPLCSPDPVSALPRDSSTSRSEQDIVATTSPSSSSPSPVSGAAALVAGVGSSSLPQLSLRPTGGRETGEEGEEGVGTLHSTPAVVSSPLKIGNHSLNALNNNYAGHVVSMTSSRGGGQPPPPRMTRANNVQDLPSELLPSYSSAVRAEQNNPHSVAMNADCRKLAAAVEENYTRVGVGGVVGNNSRPPTYDSIGQGFVTAMQQQQQSQQDHHQQQQPPDNPHQHQQQKFQPQQSLPQQNFENTFHIHNIIPAGSRPSDPFADHSECSTTFPSARSATVVDMLGNYSDITRPRPRAQEGDGWTDTRLQDGGLGASDGGPTGRTRGGEVGDRSPDAAGTPRRRLVGCGWSKSQELVETRLENHPHPLPTSFSASSSRHRTSHSLRSRRAASGGARTSGRAVPPAAPAAPEMLL